MSTFSFFLKVESPRFFPVTARVNMRVPYKVLFYGQLFPICCMNLTQTASSMSSVSWEFFLLLCDFNFIAYSFTFSDVSRNG